MTDDPTPYCVEGCGRPATTSRPMGVTADGTPTDELVCERHKLPDPSIISLWSCPLCGGCSEGNGVERRRFGHLPWKRLVHIDCPEEA